MTNALPYTVPQTAGQYTIFATREYFEQLTHDIRGTVPGDRVLLAVMSLDPAVPEIQSLLAALTNCAQRGVHATLQIDAYCFMLDEHKMPGPLFYQRQLPTGMKGIFGAIESAILALRNAGVEVVVTNPPARRFLSPFAGRSHIKASIVNDIVYLGGCNLGSMHLDAMCRWEDSTTADWLYTLLGKRVDQPQSWQAFGKQDIRHAIDKQTEIIVDVGIKKQSAIYTQALEIIDRAEEWLVITCQFFPNSTTAKHLRTALKRGVRVVPIFNHYSAHSRLHTYLQHAVTARERIRMPAPFFDTELAPNQTFLHAKILATEGEAMIGSHNYVTAGVNFGTAEIALHRTDPIFATACAQLIAQETNITWRSVK